MTIRHFEVFYAVAKCHSISLAAKELLISQPSVSQAIRELEAEMGKKLILRSKKECVLTPYGEVLLPFAASIMANVKEIGNAFLSKEEHITFGVNCISTTILPRIMSTYKDDIKKGTLSVLNLNQRELVNGLLNQEVDIAILDNFEDDERFVYDPICELSMSIYCTKTYECRDSMSLEELSRMPLIVREKESGSRRIFDEAFHKKGIIYHPLAESNNYSCIYNLVNLGFGLALLPDSLIPKNYKDQFKRISIEDETFYRQLYEVHLREIQLTDKEKKFVSSLHQIVSQTSELISE